MDIRCRRCGEPWGQDELHDTPDGLSYEEASRLFRTEGCGVVFDGAPCAEAGTETTEMIGVLTDLLGDDMDGLAADLEDAAYLGVL